jgi:CrcB protein
VKMLEAHSYGLAAGYTAGSVAAGYLGLYLATASVRRIRVLP